jgi:hypothetical protein
MSVKALSDHRERVFQEDARIVVTRVKNALSAIIDSLPGHVARGHEISKSLGVHGKLGWQIAKVLYEPDPFIAGQHIPGPASIRKFFEAARGRQVPAELIATAEGAMDDFGRLLETHAGDRESLDLLATGCARRVPEKAHLAHRKAWFAGGSFIWGVRAKAQIAAFFTCPSAGEQKFDLLRLGGFVDFQITRAGMSWPFWVVRVGRDDGTSGPQPEREPLEPGYTPSAGGMSVPLLRDFCSDPLPEFRRTRLPDGSVRDELVGARVGKLGRKTFLTAELLRNAAYRYRTAQDWRWMAVVELRTPCEVLIFDQFIHEDLFGPVRPELSAYRDLPDPSRVSPASRDDGDRLSVFESVAYLGKGLGGIRTPDIPRYSDMARCVFERANWDPARFEVFRVRMEFPPVPTTVVMHNELPPAPAEVKQA